MRFVLSVVLGALTVGPVALSSTPAIACENSLARLDADFEGARMSACDAGRRRFHIRIDPEDRPINPSPWYAFRVTPKQPGELKIILTYSDAAHRYRPKRSDDGATWRLLDASRVRERRKGRKAVLRVKMGEKPFTISAQELLLTGAYEAWTGDLAARAGLAQEEIGRSVEDRPIMALRSAPAQPRARKEHVVLLGRQHPPEVTGALAMTSFLETVFGDTPLARRFRDRFHVIAVPLINPDGVVRGHWRHNVNGVDLNRDWGAFTQPETQAVKRLIDPIAEDEQSELRLMFDFHSTKRDVFYTQTSDDETVPPRFTEQWLAGARERFDGYDVERAERPLSDLPTAKNYFFRRFGAPSITYELGDSTDRAAITASAIIFAEEMMETLLASDPALRDSQPSVSDEN